MKRLGVVGFSVFVSFFVSLNVIGFEKLDDCSVIREHLKSLPAGGGEVLIPPGQYTCSAPIVVDRENVWLHGTGKVILSLADGANAPVIVMGDAATPPKSLHNIRISDLVIEGNRTLQTKECWGGDCDEGGTTYIRNNGISVRAVNDSEIKNIFIKSARSGGVVTERDCNHLHIDNLTVTDSEFDGFAGYQTYGSLFENMYLFGNQAAGISIDIDFSTNTIRNTKIEKNGDVGIFMRDSRANLFDGVIINSNNNHGVFIAQAEEESYATCATDNEFYNLVVTGSQGAGFQLNDPCLKNRLTGRAEFSQNRDGCIGSLNKRYLDVVGSLTCNN